MNVAQARMIVLLWTIIIWISSSLIINFYISKLIALLIMVVPLIIIGSILIVWCIVGTYIELGDKKKVKL